MGYPHSENTWQAREDLNCDALLKQFEKKAEVIRDEFDGDNDGSASFVPPYPSKDSWEDGIDKVVGLRECIDDDKGRVLAVKLLWYILLGFCEINLSCRKNGQESEELLEDMIVAGPRPVLRFLLTKLKFKTA